MFIGSVTLNEVSYVRPSFEVWQNGRNSSRFSVASRRADGDWVPERQHAVERRYSDVTEAQTSATVTASVRRESP